MKTTNDAITLSVMRDQGRTMQVKGKQDKRGHSNTRQRKEREGKGRDGKNRQGMGRERK